MKLYTLQECFEQSGSKFPFTVDWYWNGIFSNRIRFDEFNKNSGFLGIYLTEDDDFSVNNIAFHASLSDVESSRYSIDMITYEKDFDKLLEE